MDQLLPGDLVRFDVNNTAGVDCSKVYMIVAVAPRRTADRMFMVHTLLGLGAGNIHLAQRHQLLRVYI